MGFIELVLLEGILLLSAGLIIFGGIRGTIFATIALSGVNYLFNDATQFWRWEIPLLIGGSVGIILLIILGKIANKGQVVGGLAGGLISLVLFGAFLTPIAAIVIFALVVGTGIVPKNKKSQVIKGFAPTFMRLILGLAIIIYGNFLTI